VFVDVLSSDALYADVVDAPVVFICSHAVVVVEDVEDVVVAIVAIVFST